MIRYRSDELEGLAGVRTREAGDFQVATPLQPTTTSRDEDGPRGHASGHGDRSDAVALHDEPCRRRHHQTRGDGVAESKPTTCRAEEAEGRRAEPRGQRGHGREREDFPAPDDAYRR